MNFDVILEPSSTLSDKYRLVVRYNNGEGGVVVTSPEVSKDSLDTDCPDVERTLCLAFWLAYEASEGRLDDEC